MKIESQKHHGLRILLYFLCADNLLFYKFFVFLNKLKVEAMLNAMIVNV